jgi:hypothetical protein
LSGFVADLSHGCPVGAKAVCHDDLRTAISFHHLLQKLQCSLAISLLCDECIKDFSLVINGPPEVVSFAIDPPPFWAKTSSRCQRHWIWVRIDADRFFLISEVLPIHWTDSATI